jgi:ABC-type transport system substrate-binding protein
MKIPTQSILKPLSTSLLTLALINFFLVFLLVGCTKTLENQKLSIFHGFEKDDVKTWDPANAYDSVSLDLLPSVVETLYQYSYLSEVYQLEPLLAAGMPTYSADHLTITIKIKKGIQYQDDPCFKTSGNPNIQSRELKAQDFVNGIKRLALPSIQSQGWWVVDGKIVGINAFHDQLANASKENISKVFLQEIAGLKALDDQTIQFILTQPDPQFLYALAMNFTSPIPSEAVSAYADAHGNLLDHPIGTGPFILSKWERNHEIILERNPNFRGEPYPRVASAIYQKVGMIEDSDKPMPFLDRIIISIMKESQPQWLNFMAGNADLIMLPKDNFKEAITDQVNLSIDLVKKGIRLSMTTGVVIRYISFNMADPLIGSNKYLRQALSSAIDREKWITIFTNNTGKPMVNAIPPGVPDRPSTQKIRYNYNLALAKDLLKKAGYPNGKGLPTIKFDLRGASTTDRQIGDFITQQFEQIGVNTEVIPNTFPAFLEKAKQGNLQVSFGGWSMDFPDAENIYQLLYGPNKSPGPGEANYQNPAYDRLYEKMSIVQPGAKRAAMIQKMDDLIQEDCPWAFGYYEASYDLSQPWLLNYRSSDLILNKYKYFKLSNELKKRYLDHK